MARSLNTETIDEASVVPRGRSVLVIRKALYDVDGLEESSWLTIALRVTLIGAVTGQLPCRPDEA